MIGVAEYMLIGWFSFCALAVFFIVRTTSTKEKPVKNTNVINHESMTHELKEQCQLILKLNKRIESLEKQAANDSMQKMGDKKDSFVIHGDLYDSTASGIKTIEHLKTLKETPRPSSKIKFEDVFDESYRAEINKANQSATELIEKLKTLKETIK